MRNTLRSLKKRYHQADLRQKRMVIMMLSLIIIFGGIILFNAFKSWMIKRYFAHFASPAVTVSSVVVKARNWEPRIHAVGNLVAVNGVEINAQTAGKIITIDFKSGQYVSLNAPLITLDDSVDQATLKANQSELALQEINYKRQTDLLTRGATSGSSVDESKAKLLQAKASVEKTEAIIRQKHISAPFAGRLGIRKVNLGQYISPGETSIVSLQSMDPLYVSFYLPEQLQNHLHLNQKIYFSVEQSPGKLFEGKIAAVNSRIDVNTHNIEVQAIVPNCPSNAIDDPAHSALVRVTKRATDGKLIISCDSKLNEQNKITEFNFIPGMFASIQVEQPILPNVLAIPSTAISYSLYGNSVYLIEKSQDPTHRGQMTVKRVFIKTGDQQENYTVVTEGLKEGQLIVSAGELKLEDGSAVIINNKEQLKDTLDLSQLGQ